MMATEYLAIFTHHSPPFTRSIPQNFWKNCAELFLKQFFYLFHNSEKFLPISPPKSFSTRWTRTTVHGKSRGSVAVQLSSTANDVHVVTDKTRQFNVVHGRGSQGQLTRSSQYL